MLKSPFSREAAALRSLLVEMRRGAGLTQRALASKLGREHSFVARVEQGERRLDVVEFLWVCRACGADPVMLIECLVRAGGAQKPSARRGRK